MARPAVVRLTMAGSAAAGNAVARYRVNQTNAEVAQWAGYFST